MTAEFADNPRADIERAVAAIPAGRVAAYGEVARRAGWPGRARLVGKVLRDASADELPWHRVLRADRRLAFPEGSEAYREQRRRLAAEGVELVRGKVPAHHFDAPQDLDAALWSSPWK